MNPRTYKVEMIVHVDDDGGLDPKIIDALNRMKEEPGVTIETFFITTIKDGENK